jgi:hypothetical protein
MNLEVARRLIEIHRVVERNGLPDFTAGTDLHRPRAAAAAGNVCAWRSRNWARCS